MELTLPVDLLLEILARSDIRTLIRCAATSKLLRCDILDPHFIRRVTKHGGIVPPCILAYLNTPHDKADPPPPLSLLHPAKSAAAWYLNDHLSSYLSCYGDDLLRGHIPVTSRGGLVLFRRRHIKRSLSNLCVYDIITGRRTVLSNPSGISLKQSGFFDWCVLLTSADGIGCSFMLFAPHLVTMHDNNNRRTIKFQATTWACGSWALVDTSNAKRGFFSQPCYAVCRGRDTVILQGGVIHWLVHLCGKIVSYNICTREHRTIKLPDHLTESIGECRLGSYYSNDGHELLRLLVIYRFKISVWHQLPGGDWASEAVMIDMEEKLRSLDPDIPAAFYVHTRLRYSGVGSNAMLLYMEIYPHKLQTGLRTLLITLTWRQKRCAFEITQLLGPYS